MCDSDGRLFTVTVPLVIAAFVSALSVTTHHPCYNNSLSGVSILNIISLIYSTQAMGPEYTAVVLTMYALFPFQVYCPMNQPNPCHPLAPCHHDLVAAHLEFPKPLPKISCFACQLLQCDA